MDQVNLKIVQSAIPKADENLSRWDNAKKGWGAASEVLESFHKGSSALNEIALLAAPVTLKARVFVLDEVEVNIVDTGYLHLNPGTQLA